MEASGRERAMDVAFVFVSQISADASKRAVVRRRFCTSPAAARVRHTLSVVERLLADLAAGGFHALKWFVHEFLLLTVRPAAGSRVASLCRVIGCVVIVASLRVELREGLLPDTTGADYTTEATVLLDRQLNARSDVFVELAMDSPQHDESRQQLHAGMTYRLAPNHQIDFHAAAGLSRAAPRNYVGIGYSFLLQGR